MPDDMLLPFTFPAIKPKKVVAAFDGGRLSSNGGVTLLALAERRVGIIERLSKLFPDERDQERVTHPLDSIVGARVCQCFIGDEDLNRWMVQNGHAISTGSDYWAEENLARSEKLGI